MAIATGNFKSTCTTRLHSSFFSVYAISERPAPYAVLCLNSVGEGYIACLNSILDYRKSSAKERGEFLVLMVSGGTNQLRILETNLGVRVLHVNGIWGDQIEPGRMDLAIVSVVQVNHIWGDERVDYGTQILKSTERTNFLGLVVSGGSNQQNQIAVVAVAQVNPIWGDERVDYRPLSSQILKSTERCNFLALVVSGVSNQENQIAVVSGMSLEAYPVMMLALSMNRICGTHESARTYKLFCWKGGLQDHSQGSEDSIRTIDSSDYNQQPEASLEDSKVTQDYGDSPGNSEDSVNKEGDEQDEAGNEREDEDDGEGNDEDEDEDEEGDEDEDEDEDEDDDDEDDDDDDDDLGK